MLSVEQAEGLRQQVFNSFVQQRQILTLTGVQPFLASLDYLDMLRDRQEEPRTGDFEAITKPFQEATGKTIHRPRIDPSAPFGAVLEVETPSGQRHTLDQLSSGEQEVLALAYYIRRLSASGGLLLIDEPELHLHPALQRSLFAVMENLAERAQIWIVTHSPQLVTTAPLSAVLHMTPESGEDTNQLVKASDEEARAQLLTDIGFNPVEVLQSDCLVVVEGEVDARRLPAAFPLPLGRAAVFVAGSATGVEATARSLISGQTPVPWLAVRDRDLLDADQLAADLASDPRLFIWPNRMLENELLSPSLVAKTLTRSGRDTSAVEVTHWLREIADGHREQILAELTDAALTKRHPHTSDRPESLLERRKAYLTATAAATEAKLRDFETVAREVEESLDARWEDDWFRLMHGKRALGELASRTPFKSQTDFVSAITHTLRDEPGEVPEGFRLFLARLEQVKGAART